MKPLTLKETKLKEEMKNNCLKGGKYKDEKAKDKFKMLCHLEDFEVKYWELQQENQELKKQLEEYQLQNIDLRADIMIQKKAFPNKLIKDKTFYDLYDMPIYEDLLNQQKEFIEYLENMLDYENDIFSVVRVKDVLQKYKSIIGVSDENTIK